MPRVDPAHFVGLGLFIAAENDDAILRFVFVGPAVSDRGKRMALIKVDMKLGKRLRNAFPFREPRLIELI